MTDLSDAYTAMPSLKGKRVIITGGTTGIGRAIAVLLASEGARVFICGRSAAHLADALTRIREVGEGDGITLDLAEPASPKAFVEAGRAYLGGVDVSVINAAVAAEGLSEMSEEDVRYAIATDFTGYLMTAHASIAALGDAGDIVLIGSMSAHVLGPNSTVYAGIKYGIQGFAEAFRREMGPKGIRVALVEPGLTGSTMQEPEMPPEKQREKIRDETALRAEDIAVGVQYILTQPRRAVVQQLTITPRNENSE
ncbi:NADP-dependent 3-hydroxy acid dehydrogenase YdfG [Sphingomonas sp. BE270]|jgi:NADP-dependent 3-hydroxy acid dehydrogenase YdfG|uniref:SDR family oxidoreductase n=1 Tax=unclassified Sphingomonas TaxID=196159 RepID=UPI00053D6279|nr:MULTISPECIES: SDR family NAD(P)-dependent oxidoreductase [unclassified Sphingomonas]MDR6847424.1 NADP-dependent 3-hydroxy acid dehydrogenase YdfG [Sphingomonas sp. BE137]MDR7256968.1 NADP-dependent 3-hydroxy acid dehydrogenase YdfG [Sphingomonas sp. BE270]